MLSAAQVAAPSMGRSGGPAPAAKVAWSTHEQDVVLKDAQQLNLDSLYQQEPIGTWPPEDAAGDDGD